MYILKEVACIVKLLNLFRRPSALNNLSPQEVAVQSEQSPKPVIIDVRTSLEFNSGHIVGALSFPLGSELTGVQELDRTTPIILICKTGHRSQAAAQTLLNNGFTHLYHLDGGMNRWRREKLPVVK